MNNVERDLDKVTCGDAVKECAEMGLVLLDMILQGDETCRVRMFGQLWELSMKKVLQ